jgi:NAD(P)-dependent dehydrogenase (short-subunit alcohol dehydrogenase family)
VLVNSAGIYPRTSTAATDEATFDQVYAVNVKAPFFLTAASVLRTHIDVAPFGRVWGRGSRQ